MSGPQTENGRSALVLVSSPGSQPMAGWTAQIVAIEREAVAAFLASPEAAEEHKNAMRRVLLFAGIVDEDDIEVASPAILAAWQQDRAKV